jgi:phosphoribosyl 1,2-cyclic phosphate phosphodiesterase
MEILFLGTSAAEGWPALFCTCENCRRALTAGGKDIRTRPSMLVDRSILIDPGPDLYYHILKYAFRLADLAAIIVTHSHEDHLAADEFRLAREPFAVRDKLRPTPIWGNDQVLGRLRAALKAEDEGGIREQFGFELHQARAFESFSIGSYTITPLEADHMPTEPCLFYCIESNGRTFLQANDTGYLPDTTWRWLEGRRLDGVSLECTNGTIEGWKGHLGVKEVIDVVERLRKEGQLAPSAPAVVTHFSHNGGLLHEELEAALNPHGIDVAYDGLRIEI